MRTTDYFTSLTKQNYVTFAQLAKGLTLLTLRAKLRERANKEAGRKGRTIYKSTYDLCHQANNERKQTVKEDIKNKDCGDNMSAIKSHFPKEA